jgi:Flp pilus assembly protein TadD
MQAPSHSSPAETLYYEALDLLAAGDAAQAAQLLRRCLEVEPAMLDAMHGLIRAHQECGELDEAIAVARRLSEIDPDEILAHTSLSILYQRKGLVAEAESEAMRAKLLGWKRQLQKP